METQEIKINIDKDKLTDYGFDFDDLKDMYYYFDNMIGWLECHNKNYTKEQYHRIYLLKGILDCLEVE